MFLRNFATHLSKTEKDLEIIDKKRRGGGKIKVKNKRGESDMRSKNKISHKMMAVLAAALIAAMLLTGCGGGGAEEAEARAVARLPWSRPRHPLRRLHRVPTPFRRRTLRRRQILIRSPTQRQPPTRILRLLPLLTPIRCRNRLRLLTRIPRQTRLRLLILTPHQTLRQRPTRNRTKTD